MVSVSVCLFVTKESSQSAKIMHVWGGYIDWEEGESVWEVNVIAIFLVSLALAISFRQFTLKTFSGKVQEKLKIVQLSFNLLKTYGENIGVSKEQRTN